jgi:hypothetical protein
VVRLCSRAPGPGGVRRWVASGVVQSGAQPAQNGRNSLLSQGLCVRATLRCHKAKRSQAVKGGPSGPSEGSRAAAPLTAWGAELGRTVWRTRSPRGPTPGSSAKAGLRGPVEALTPPTDMSVAPFFSRRPRSARSLRITPPNVSQSVVRRTTYPLSDLTIHPIVARRNGGGE